LDDNRLLLAGSVPSALMALIADFGFGVIERHFDPTLQRSRRRPLRMLIGTVLIVAIALTAFATWRAMRARAVSSQSHGLVTVGSKDFTESELLAEIVAQMLESRNMEVDRRFDLGGNLCESSLVAGKIDLYPEYTGTSFTEILHHPPITDPRAVYDQVKREYAEGFNVEVSAPLGFENTFAILVRGNDARTLKLKTISDAAKYAPQWRAGFGHDFVSRADGYPGFSRTYGLRFAEAPREMALDLTYTALASKKVDMIAGNSTDGRIAALDLVQLEDDRHYFPPYEAVFLTRKDALTRAPALGEVLRKLEGAISTEEMRKLNYEVDGLKRDKKVVVHEWLVKKGFL
jgi:osmoprotectant transport system permease protein